jgi:extradiol dioxygenase family protein
MNIRILLALVALTAAQLPAQLAAITGNRGVSMGHLHVVVRDVDAQKKFWVALGGTPVKNGTLQAQGVDFDVAPRMAPNGTTKVAFLYDPWGTYIELTQGLSPAK